MASNVMDVARATAGSTGVNQLLVLWQHPESREIVPIGRLDRTDDSYTFEYTQAAADVDGFRGLPGLGTPGRVTHTVTLPAIFQARVMSPDRPDYSHYIAELGLDSENATPWEQIVESGGERAGDTLQFMQVPRVRDGRAHARFLTSGVRHIPDRGLTFDGKTVHISRTDHEASLHGLTRGSRVQFVAESDNEHDPCATLVVAHGSPLGWVPRALSSSFRDLLTAGPVEGVVVRVNGPDTASHLRLVLDVDVAAPSGFTFDRERRWS